MLVLTRDDECALRSIAGELSHSPVEEQDTFDILYKGFSLYGDDGLIIRHRTRESYFREAAQRLLENIGDSGKTYEEACDSIQLWGTLYRTVKSLGIPDADAEDVTQDVALRALKYRWVEDYNPTRSALRHYLFVMVRNYVRTRHSRESHKVTSGAVRLDGIGEEGQGGGVSLLYAEEGVGSLEERIDAEEVLTQFVNYLEAQPPFRIKLNRGFKYLCTLLPPGTEELPTDQEMELFLIEEGLYRCRVTTPELWDHGILPMVPCELLVDYISTDTETGERLIIPGTDEWACQKSYPNPEYDTHTIPIREQRSLKEVYLFLRDGWQIDEIARWYRTPSTSVPAWIKRLEKCFRDFWVVSDLIPRNRKVLAVPNYQCPRCEKLFWKRRRTCLCGVDMSQEMAKLRFDAYPWPRVYVTRETQERLGNRKSPLEVMRGSLSVVGSSW